MFLSELKTALFSLTLTLLLILHVQADFLGIQSDGVHAIATGPEIADLPAEDAEAVFRCPYDMILAMPQGV